MTAPTPTPTPAWETHDSSSSQISGAIVISTILGVAVGGIGTVLLIGKIDTSTAEHAAQGVPIVLTAFGAAMVAIGLLLRQWEPAKDADVRYKEWRLTTAISRRPDLTDPALVKAGILLKTFTNHYEKEAQLDTQLKSSKKRAARIRGTASGIEFAGAIILLTGAGFGVFVWDLI